MEHKKQKQPKIRLLALDLDGTLFNRAGVVSEGNRAALREAAAQGTELVIATGRPYVGLPLEVLNELQITYAITGNGAAVYRVPDKQCLLEECMPAEQVLRILPKLRQLRIYYDVFVDGCGYGYTEHRQRIEELPLSESLRHYIRSTRTFLPDFDGFLRDSGRSVQKISIDFLLDEEQNWIDEPAVREILAQEPDLTMVSGGICNLELTKAGVFKGTALQRFGAMLGIPMAETMAIGDSENDRSMIQMAGLGVAMGNAEACVLEAADQVTADCEADGVAAAIRRWIL